MNAAALPDVSIESFEAGSLDAAAFDHEAHVYVAWLYLERYPLADALPRLASALRRLTEKLGLPDKYHETITWFFMVLVEERRARPCAGGWFAFRRENDDICHGSETLRRYYSQELLASDLARRTFLLPDRLIDR